jgi:Spy/CpxP family protein refolding chaperone
MKSPVRTIIAVVILTLFAGAAGFWAGAAYGGRHVHSAGLDDILHRNLGLTSDQEKQIAAFEAKFARDRKELDGQMRAANRALARALDGEHAFGDDARKAIAQFHTAMAALQEQTILHVLEMRAVLTPEQAKRFDATIAQALSADPP